MIPVNCRRLPTISRITQKTIKDVGDTTEFTCTVMDAMDYPILWEKINKEGADEPVILSSGSILIIKNSRFSVQQKYGESSCLTLKVLINQC